MQPAATFAAFCPKQCRYSEFSTFLPELEANKRSACLQLVRDPSRLSLLSLQELNMCRSFSSIRPDVKATDWGKVFDAQRTPPPLKCNTSFVRLLDRYHAFGSLRPLDLPPSCRKSSVAGYYGTGGGAIFVLASHEMTSTAASQHIQLKDDDRISSKE